MRRTVTLQFPTNETLWNFWNQIAPAPYIVLLAQNKLTQNPSEEEIELAVTSYGAVVVRADNEEGS